MRDLIARAVDRGGLAADDLVAVLLPLFRQVAQLHEIGRVAPLRGLSALSVDDGGRVRLDASGATSPQRNRTAMADAERMHSSAARGFRGGEVLRDLSDGYLGGASLGMIDADAVAQSARGDGARIVAGWQIWEHVAGQHDELTDIASLGELLAALACGLDLSDEEDASALARYHANLFAINPRIHPVIAAVASAMVEPDRRRRGQDLTGFIERLRTYRDQPEDFDLDRVLMGAESSGDRRVALLSHLRERLFDLSRRNPLLHFRHTQRSLNLTEASVPLVLDPRNLMPAHLFTWGGPASQRLIRGRQVHVASVVRWDDAPYAITALDALISAARRDRAEYGQDQLRLVPAFLHWHDLKNDPAQRIASPLVLVPAALSKQRGVRDSYRLAVTSTDAEVNPVLRHQLRELYGIMLPERIDLAEPSAIENLRDLIRGQGRASEPGLLVNLLDEPRIGLVRHRAQMALQAYRRRRVATAPTVGRRHYAYSYRHPNYAPLGIQIFQDRLQRLPIPVAAELGDRPAPRQAGVPATVEQEMFSLNPDGDANPYSWDVELCSVTLANFNYRTLSLVRDYEALIAEPRVNAPFDELFSTDPRDVGMDGDPIPLRDSYLVVPADGSQTAALAQARSADNFVIQGPPGTGKSQTITNLIADCVARGLSVLFVCQKRAALDVVHARLRSQGLDELCTLIHDSQADRKGFVHGLKATYEKWLADAEPVAHVEQRRDQLIREIESALGEIGAYEQALTERAAGLRVTDLIERLIADPSSRWGNNLPPALRRLLPSATAWESAKPAVDSLAAALERAGQPRVFARTPLRLLDAQILHAPRADAEVAFRAGQAVTALDAVTDVLNRAAGRIDVSLSGADRVAAMAAVLGPLAERGRGSALDPSSALGAELRQAAASHARLQAEAARAAAAAAGWRDPLGPDEARAALDVARRKEHAAMRFVSGRWRRVRRMVRSRYHASDRPSPPTVARAIELLVAVHRAGENVTRSAEATRHVWGHPDPVRLVQTLDAAGREDGRGAFWRDRLAADAGAARTAQELPHRLAELRRALDGLVTGTEQADLPLLRADLVAFTLPGGQQAVRVTAPALRDLAGHPDGASLLEALRHLDAEPDQIGYATYASAVQDACAAAPALDRVDGTALARLLDRVTSALPALYRANAKVIVARLRQRFSENVQQSQRSVSGMDSEDGERKQTWAAGRRQLEHEFGKVRAYKSIRQLASGEPGAVVAAMRPVWLMSPASVSDALPLAESFDVVVYDEASQVPVEEAVPALHRARQAIVVGDRMQLPPTTYFQTRVVGDAEEDWDDEPRLGAVLDADSFLAVSSVRLPSTMLTWHYRSRYEALIQFSNAAFYQGRLATIPDRAPSQPRADALEIDGEPGADVVTRLVDGVLARSISVVRVRDGVYEQRINVAEARCIAHLVRGLLRRETGFTVGIVAFSEYQQGEIERALERLATADPDFARRYEAELNREEDGQGVGLFVKNLENVQGDERDVIIMSVCYAPGPDGRMRMNFGPINNAGGERRLNVIFSRAKQHLVLVSTIDHNAITNVYNDGANTLREFLHYADAVSRGDEMTARAVVMGRRGRSGAVVAATAPPVVEQIAGALRRRGLDVATDLGQTRFRCDLALREPGNMRYGVAVLVDHSARLDEYPIEERRVTQPSALRSAGWEVAHVPATDWYRAPERVIDELSGLVCRATGPSTFRVSGREAMSDQSVAYRSTGTPSGS